jgi:hypothetical protein
MDRRNPKVTIGVTVYNGDNYLAEALESILAQTFDDYEVVISDNGSTDATPEICRQFARRDRRVRYYRHEQNRGAAWNYNRVFELARGEYFKWLAHDDLMAPEFLAECVAQLDANPDAVWCQSQIVLIDRDGQELVGNINAWNNPSAPPCEVHSVKSFDPGGRQGDRCSDSPSERFAAVLLGAAWAIDLYGLIRTDALRRTRGHLPTYGSEKILVGELSLMGRYIEVPQPLKLIRIHEAASGGITETAQQQQFMGTCQSRWIHPRVQLFLGQIATPLRAKLPLGQRVRCLWALGRYMFQVRKWGGIVRSLFSRRGTGNGNQMFLPSRNGSTAHEDLRQKGAARQRSAAIAQQVVSGGSAWMIAVMEEGLPLL